MKVNDFVDEYKKADEKGKKKLVAEHVTRPYVPYLTKVAVAQAIVDQTQYVRDENATEEEGRMPRGEYRLNTPIRYLVTLMQMVAEYTDLEQSENTYDDFDALQECGALSNILEAVQNDFTIFENVVQMTADDVHATENSLVTHLKEVETALLDSAQELADSINDEINKQQVTENATES